MNNAKFFSLVLLLPLLSTQIMPTMRRVSKDKLVDLSDTLVQATIEVDDGCDWTA